MIKVVNFTRKFKEKVAVNNLSIEVKRGCICGFIGHNGAGKTTTIKSIVGINNDYEGEILINDISVKNYPNRVKKIIAYIPDNPDIYDFMKGIDYLNFIADAYQMTYSKRKKLIEKYSSLFGMENVLNDLVSSYSHGMKQKLVIISAFIHEPKVLILDEPFVGLDPKASHILKKLMKEMCENGGSIFYSTHVLEVAQNLCDNLVIIKNGELIVSGETNDVLKDKSLETLFLELTE